MKKLLAVLVILLGLTVVPNAYAQTTVLKDFHGDSFGMKFVDGPKVTNTTTPGVADDGTKYENSQYVQEYDGSAVMVQVTSYDTPRNDSTAEEDAAIARSFATINKDNTVIRTRPNSTWTAGGLSGREGVEGVTLADGSTYMIAERIYIRGTKLYLLSALVRTDSSLTGADLRAMFDSFHIE